ncbi:hypothetical protein EJ03DRAFT_349512 [Teratosphaeria nubilosa]|uniref:Uncharacterized protein n=1 Tax=Teratosphaeria nubilosa TaxID=161662 RepID=A0A6G1LEY2_9PEZI|nr:hypothetical protein EJ03DRAFT_349512 [Teratosphaeria nubilosa]
MSVSQEVEKLKRAFWEGNVPRNTYGTHPSGSPRALWHTFTALRPIIQEQYDSLVNMWEDPQRQSQDQRRGYQDIQDSKYTDQRFLQSGHEAPATAQPSAQMPSTPAHGSLQTPHANAESDDRSKAPTTRLENTYFLCATPGCSRSEWVNPMSGGNNGVRCTACCQSIRSTPGMRCVWESAMKDITHGVGNGTIDIRNQIATRQAACWLHKTSTVGRLCLCPPATAQQPLGGPPSQAMQAAKLHDPNIQATTPASRSDQVHQPRPPCDRDDRTDFTAGRSQVLVDPQHSYSRQSGVAPNPQQASLDVVIKELQDELWAEDFLRTARNNDSLPLPAANASADQLFNYIKTARPPLWHLLPDRVPVARIFVGNNGFTYHLAENAVKALQRRGYDWAFFMGKQAEFGLHSTTAGMDCMACRRMFIASGRMMGDEILKRIHERQLGNSGLEVEPEGAP